MTCHVFIKGPRGSQLDILHGRHGQKNKSKKAANKNYVNAVNDGSSQNPRKHPNDLGPWGDFI